MVVLGGWLDAMILEVFSNLNDSMILRKRCLACSWIYVWHNQWCVHLFISRPHCLTGVKKFTKLCKRVFSLILFCKPGSYCSPIILIVMFFHRWTVKLFSTPSLYLRITRRRDYFVVQYCSVPVSLNT